MNIIVHYPKTAKELAELEKRVATVHIDAVTTRINNLSVPNLRNCPLLRN